MTAATAALSAFQRAHEGATRSPTVDREGADLEARLQTLKDLDDKWDDLGETSVTRCCTKYAVVFLSVFMILAVGYCSRCLPFLVALAENMSKGGICHREGWVGGTSMCHFGESLSGYSQGQCIIWKKSALSDFFNT